MSDQGHHCLLIELKLYNVSTCIGGKTGGWDKTGGRPWTQPTRIAPLNDRCLFIAFYPRDTVFKRGFVVATCLSGCLSHAGIVSKLLNLC